MSVDEEKKKFVIRHTFTDVKNMKNESYEYGKQERHFSIPWNIYIVLRESSSTASVCLSCHKLQGKEKWSIDTTTIGELVTLTGEKLPVKNHVFSQNTSNALLSFKKPIKEYIVDGNLTVECHVTINSVTGIVIPIDKRIFRSFDDESAKEISDVVLVVKDQKFYVNKMYLAGHSSYFKSLFCGSFNESKQSEIELKDIDSWDFQKFLEALYGELVVNEDNIEGILELADMYDTKTVVRQCEQFLFHRSQQDLKFKFNVALKYNMKELQKKCISEVKSVEDIEKIIPKENDHLDKEALRNFLNLAIEFYKKK